MAERLTKLLKNLRKPIWEAPIKQGSKEHTALALMWQSADEICRLKDENEQLALRLLKGVIDSDLLRTYDGSALERADGYIEKLESDISAYRSLGTPEELAALVEANRWIPVTERLPDEELAKFLVVTKFGHIALAQRRYGSKDWLVGGLRIKDDITHWRLLPEAPKEVQG